MNQTNPSAFYDLMAGAEKFSLVFPPDQDGFGPHWLTSGELVRADGVEAEVEDVEAVFLGNNRYRLADRCSGPFSSLRLHWGDEFSADRSEETTLTLTKLVVPQPYEHFRLLTSSDFNINGAVAEMVHSFGGGWETVAGGMLTLTVPASRVQEFQAKLSTVGLLLGLIKLTD